MSEIIGLGQELAWEVRRLAGDEPIYPETAHIVDFGDTDWIGYKAQPWGLIAVNFQSEYVHIYGQPVLTNNDDSSIIANILVETRYRSVIATGDLLCDRELYEIHADGNIEAMLSIGELSAATIVDGDYGDEDDSEQDLSPVIFGLGESASKTPQQEANNFRLDELSDLVRLLHDEDPIADAIQKEIHKIEDAGEESVAMPLHLSVAGLKQLLARMKLIEKEDRLGIISAVSIVDSFIY